MYVLCADIIDGVPGHNPSVNMEFPFRGATLTCHGWLKLLLAESYNEQDFATSIIKYFSLLTGDHINPLLLNACLLMQAWAVEQPGSASPAQHQPWPPCLLKVGSHCLQQGGCEGA